MHTVGAGAGDWVCLIMLLPAIGLVFSTGTEGGASLGGAADDPPPNISAMNCLVKSSALVAAPALSAFNLVFQSDFYVKNEIINA